MKGYRKIVVLISLVVFSLLLSACGGGSGQDASPSGGGEEKASSPPGAAGFKEYPVGDDVQAEGMNIAAVYFQPVPMTPEEKAGLKPQEADMHLEADISALKNNPSGFGFGQFVPYLTVKYDLENKDTGEKVSGSMMPMNASDGPHCGANVKLPGAGKYRLTYAIEAPRDYLLHTDAETGVEGRFWRKPIVVEWDFSWLGRKW